jgi:hypothetical protein
MMKSDVYKWALAHFFLEQTKKGKNVK